MEKFLSLQEAADLLQLSRYAVVRLHEQGFLLPARQVGVRQERQYTLEQLRDYSLRMWGCDLTAGERPDLLALAFVQLGEWAGSLGLTEEQDKRFDEICEFLGKAISGEEAKA